MSSPAGDCTTCGQPPHECEPVQRMSPDAGAPFRCPVCGCEPHQCEVLPIVPTAKLPPEKKTWLTTYEVGDMIGQSDDNVRRLCERGVWPSAYQARAGAQWRIKRADVEAWLESLRPKKRGVR